MARPGRRPARKTPPRRTRSYKGILPFLADLEEKRYKQYIRVFLRRYQTANTCPSCNGTRLQPDALNVRIAGKNIAEVSALTIEALRDWTRSVELHAIRARSRLPRPARGD